MNQLIYSVDRPTHMKIVVAALVAGVGVEGFAIAVRINTDNGYSQTAPVSKIKARHQDGKFAVALRTLDCFETAGSIILVRREQLLNLLHWI